MFQLLILLLFSVLYVSTNSVESKYHEPGSSEVTLRIIDPNNKDTKKYYAFSDERKTVQMECVLKSTGDINDEGITYVLKFYIDRNDEKTEIVTLEPGSSASMLRSFTIHKSDKEIVCKAFRDKNPFEYAPLICRLPLVYTPHNVTEPDIKSKPSHNATIHDEKTNPSINVTDDKNAKPKLNTTTQDEKPEPVLKVIFSRDRKPKPSQSVPPNPDVLEDTNSRATFTCTLQKHAALLSWYQVNGSERVILKSIPPKGLRHVMVKTLKDSDDHTYVYCAVRYILNEQISDEIKSKSVTLSFNKTKVQLKATDDKFNMSLWLGINGAVFGLVLIIVTILFIAMLRYRRKVKQFERDQNMRFRPPMTPPNGNKYEGNEYTKKLRNIDASVENLYEQVYGHGAGLKRPKVRPAEKKLLD